MKHYRVEVMHQRAWHNSNYIRCGAVSGGPHGLPPSTVDGAQVTCAQCLEYMANDVARLLVSRCWHLNGFPCPDCGKAADSIEV